MSECFNPRPPRRVGATKTCATLREFLDVSILAHPGGWALQFPVHRRRYLCTVSILAHPGGWALHRHKAKPRKPWVFQSSPTPEGGRYKDCWILHPRPSRFQSSPTPEGGRYLINPVVKSFWKLFQSSPTPEGGRYLSPWVWLSHSVSFQSSPTPEGGRYTGPTNESWHCGVSILAHPGGWALQIELSARIDRTKVSILAHPGGWALLGTVNRCRGIECFNPRPPRRVGATIVCFSDLSSADVSILAHPGGWALLSSSPSSTVGPIKPSFFTMTP